MKENPPVAIAHILREAKDRLSILYGPRLRGVYLYGSYARGEADAESDVDLLIVLDQLHDYSSEIDRTSSLISQMSLDHGTSISRVFASENSWLEDCSLFFLNLREEAIPA